jgi:septum site-determining protein MinC
MSVALPANTLTTFEIKSANLPLVALLLKSTDLAALASELSARFGDIPDFFDQDPLLIDLSPLQSAGTGQPAAQLDFAALANLLASYQLVPLAIKGGSPAQMEAARAAGLAAAGDAQVLQSRAAAANPSSPPATTTAAAAAAAAAPGSKRTSAPAAAPGAAPAAGALVVDKPLRSGQQVYARGRDLVVLAMVNPGAEVIADGHIHVYAPLRGKAMAGARGNTDARIFSLSLDAELISIAGVYRTSENPLPEGIAGKPVQVRLVPGDAAGSGDKLVMTVVGA